MLRITLMLWSCTITPRYIKQWTCIAALSQSFSVITSYVQPFSLYPGNSVIYLSMWNDNDKKWSIFLFFSTIHPSLSFFHSLSLSPSDVQRILGARTWLALYVTGVFYRLCSIKLFSSWCEMRAMCFYSDFTRIWNQVMGRFHGERTSRLIFSFPYSLCPPYSVYSSNDGLSTESWFGHHTCIYNMNGSANDNVYIWK